MKSSAIKHIVLSLVAITALLLSGCSNDPEGKWLDYGQGVLNLRLVTRITTHSGHILSDDGPKTIYCDDFGLQFENAEATRKAFRQIKQFMQGNDSYLRIEL